MAPVGVHSWRASDRQHFGVCPFSSEKRKKEQAPALAVVLGVIVVLVPVLVPARDQLPLEKGSRVACWVLVTLAKAV